MNTEEMCRSNALSAGRLTGFHRVFDIIPAVFPGFVVSSGRINSMSAELEWVHPDGMRIRLGEGPGKSSDQRKVDVWLLRQSPPPRTEVVEHRTLSFDGQMITPRDAVAVVVACVEKGLSRLSPLLKTLCSPPSLCEPDICGDMFAPLPDHLLQLFDTPSDVDLRLVEVVYSDGGFRGADFVVPKRDLAGGDNMRLWAQWSKESGCWSNSYSRTSRSLLAVLQMEVQQSIDRDVSYLHNALHSLDERRKIGQSLERCLLRQPTTMDAVSDTVAKSISRSHKKKRK